MHKKSAAVSLTDSSRFYFFNSELRITNSALFRLNLFHLAAAVIMGEYFFKITALLCHTARSVLAHTDAVPVTAHGKYEFTRIIIDAEICRTKIKRRSDLCSRNLFAAHLKRFKRA